MLINKKSRKHHPTHACDHVSSNEHTEIAVFNACTPILISGPPRLVPTLFSSHPDSLLPIYPGIPKSLRHMITHISLSLDAKTRIDWDSREMRRRADKKSLRVRMRLQKFCRFAPNQWVRRECLRGQMAPQGWPARCGCSAASDVGEFET